MAEFFGKYRGKVVANADPSKLGRLQVRVPAVLGENTSSWAMPSSPYAGDQVGFFALPPVDGNVWVEFEGGNSDFPIWSGCFWGDGEMPASPATVETKLLKTDGVTLTLDDTQGGGGLTLEVASPAVSTPLTLTMDSNGIELKTASASVKLSQSGIDVVNAGASVKLTSASVSVNDGALEVV